MFELGPSATAVAADISTEMVARVLDRFAVSGQVIDLQPGPTVTVVRFKPDEITAVVKLKARERDIAFYLKVPNVRVTYDNRAGLICIEVPNRDRGRVALARLLSEIPAGNLMIPAGVSVTNQPVWFSLAEMPHLLVAGQTGSGKSVFLNSCITSLVAEYTPAEVQLILVDPKRVEFNSYAGLPHLGGRDIIFETADVLKMLDGLDRLMRQRYEDLQAAGLRNITEYEPKDRVPFVVLVIDELADLFGNAPEAQDKVVRLGQLGRASGIHMVLATQRPSHDIITGRLKANFPARAAFRVSTAVDSRVVMDQSGAEQLLGKGDAIFKVPGFDDQRVTGCFVDDDAMKLVVNWWKGQGVFNGVDLPEAKASKPKTPRIVPDITWESVFALEEDLQDGMLDLHLRGYINLRHSIH